MPFLVHLRLNTFSWTNVSEHLGLFVKMHSDFFAVRPLDQEVVTFDAQHVALHCFNALVYFCLALQTGGLIAAFSFSAVRPRTHCRKRRIRQAQYDSTRHDTDDS
jgi:hypothetical protein